MPEEQKPSSHSTETLDHLAAVYLDRLEKGDCDPGDQPMASAILGEALRRAQNMLRASREATRLLAEGIERERTA